MLFHNLKVFFRYNLPFSSFGLYMYFALYGNFDKFILSFDGFYGIVC